MLPPLLLLLLPLLLLTITLHLTAGENIFQHVGAVLPSCCLLSVCPPRKVALRQQRQGRR